MKYPSILRFKWCVSGYITQEHLLTDELLMTNDSTFLQHLPTLLLYSPLQTPHPPALLIVALLPFLWWRIFRLSTRPLWPIAWMVVPPFLWTIVLLGWRGRWLAACSDSFRLVSCFLFSCSWWLCFCGRQCGIIGGKVHLGRRRRRLLQTFRNLSIAEFWCWRRL